MKTISLISSTLFCYLFSASLAAEEYVEWIGANAGVNWSAGEAQAEGAGLRPPDSAPAAGRLLACRAAVVDAQRNLLESIEGVRVQGTTLVSNMMVESDVIKSSVDGLLKGARIVKREPKDDGSCVVQVTAPLGGQFAADVYGQVFTNQQTARHKPTLDVFSRLLHTGIGHLVPAATAANPAQAQPQPWRDAIDRLSSRLSALEDLLSTHPAIVEAQDQGPSGLVLDARGSNFIPSMSPKIRKLRSGVIYPNANHQSARRERGQLVSLFTRDLDTALRHPIVGERPMVVKGLRTFGDTRTEIVLGEDSSARLEGLIADGFLNDAGVIIVL